MNTSLLEEPLEVLVEDVGGCGCGKKGGLRGQSVGMKSEGLTELQGIEGQTGLRLAPSNRPSAAWNAQLCPCQQPCG